MRKTSQGRVEPHETLKETQKEKEQPLGRQQALERAQRLKAAFVAQPSSYAEKCQRIGSLVLKVVTVTGHSH
jgi:hypothetical protein